MDVSVLLISIIALFIAEMGSGLVTQQWRTGFSLLVSGLVCSSGVLSRDGRIWWEGESDPQLLNLNLAW